LRETFGRRQWHGQETVPQLRRKGTVEPSEDQVWNELVALLKRHGVRVDT
jgi:hypothetical protein